MNSPASTAALREVLTDAIRYWEPRRIPYNAVLVLVVIGIIVRAWPQSRVLISFSSILPLFVLAVLANICYTAAYAEDVVVQFSAFRATWHRWR
jgi:hypothetical protein